MSYTSMTVTVREHHGRVTDNGTYPELEKGQPVMHSLAAVVYTQPASSGIHLSGADWFLLAVAGLLSALILFVAGWAATGWGVSIAVRSYRWCMRRHTYPGYHTEMVADPDQASQVKSR